MNARGRVGRRLIGGAIVTTVASLLLAACGGGESEIPERVSQPPEPSAIVRIAVAGPIDTIDPLFAATRTERLIARQVHEPLISRIDPPFGGAAARRGPARLLDSEGNSVWSFELRSGVSFQDETPLNADAVIANYERWVANGVAERLLPEVEAVFSPRPGEVRFQLSDPVPDFNRRVGAARLGLVSPEAIAEADGGPVEPGPTGAGPYEIGETQPTRLLMVRAGEWWGQSVGLGPGINQLDFVITPGEDGRAAQLRSGTVSIADQLSPRMAEELAEEPLLFEIGNGATAIATSAAVRGLGSVSADQSLSELWLTELR